MSETSRHVSLRRSLGPRLRRAWIGLGCCVGGGVAVALEHGFDRPVLPAILLGPLALIATWLALALGGDIAWRSVGRDRWRSTTGLIGEGLVVVAGVLDLLGVGPLMELCAVAALVHFAIRLNGLLARTMANPSLLFPASFGVLIAVATLLLKLPAATPPDRPISWLDALFTSTSAVCVTGLAVRDTAGEFTFFGQAVILGAIQLGGLGVMIFGSTLALLFGARLSHKEHVTLSNALDEYPAHRISRFVWFIVLTTVAMEMIAALVLLAMWPGTDAAGVRLSFLDRLWQAVFHSVSAFCNAGFDVTGQSMVALRSHPAPYLGIVPAIVMGGLGFVVLEDLFRRFVRRRGRGGARPRLSTHTKLVLVTTAALLAIGTAVLFVAQLRTPGTPLGQRVLDAAFMSVSARTAGFNSVPMDSLAPGSEFMLMVLMAVGGSPGSTAGGMKTVVLAVLVLAVVSTVRRREEVEVFGRSLPESLVKKAATVAFGLVAVVSGAALALDLTESAPFDALLFEAVSAATTTGLSLGITADLSPVGRLIIICTMFLGRVGPLAVLASLIGGGGAAAGTYRLPRDNVSLG
ncbi:MAG: hypothetical protein KDA05_04495 [Phycisphaerales bacterium]|nr:hypothetical protein [Phycisphaerales bacterium]